MADTRLQTFTLSSLKTLIAQVLAEKEYRTFHPPTCTDIKSALLLFGAKIWHQAHRESMIEAKRGQECEENSWSQENSFLVSLQVDQKQLRGEIMERDKQLEFLRQQLQQWKDKAKTQASSILGLKDTILKLTEAYEETKQIHREQLHQIGSNHLLSLSSTDAGQNKKVELYQLSYQLSTAHRRISDLQNRLEASEETNAERRQREETLKSETLLQKSDIRRMEQKIRLLEEANQKKKQAIEELLRQQS